jgi:hypothetical protein
MINPTGPAVGGLSIETTNAVSATHTSRQPGPADEALEQMAKAFEQTIYKQVATRADSNHDGVIDPAEKASLGETETEILDNHEARSKYTQYTG